MVTYLHIRDATEQIKSSSVCRNQSLVPSTAMSLSTQQQKDGNRKLKQWLENEQRIVTYRDISREISCHVNHAKK